MKGNTPGQRAGHLSPAAEEKLAQVVDDLAERLCEGKRLDWPTCLKEYPDEAAELKELAPAIEILLMYGKTEPYGKGQPGTGEAAPGGA